MTRFLPLTRGGWPAEVLCEATVGVTPLCVKHQLPNGNVSVQMHRLDGRISLRGESPHDLIPAPEPSVAAYEAARDAFQKDAEVQEHGWVLPMWVIGEMLCAAYAIDGITPQQQPDRVAELEAEVAKLRAERDDAREEVERLTAELGRYRNWVPSASAVTEADIKACSIKELLTIAFRHDFPGAKPSTGEQA